jgi:glycosyltransferase involved in cell wall biosynthesis
LVNLLNRAALMVYAPRLEPFGLAPLEANACGAPVVAVAEGGVRETIIDCVNGLLVKHSNDLPAAIQRLLSDPAYARQLGEQGCALAQERWSLAAAVDRIQVSLLAAAQAKST